MFSIHGGTQIIHFNRCFHYKVYKPSIFGETSIFWANHWGTSTTRNPEIPPFVSCQGAGASMEVVTCIFPLLSWIENSAATSWVRYSLVGGCWWFQPTPLKNDGVRQLG